MSSLLETALFQSNKLINDFNKVSLMEINQNISQLFEYVQKQKLVIRQLETKNQQLSEENQMLREQINRHHETFNQSILMLRLNEDQAQMQQKRQFEEAIVRQLNQIETLINDKKILGDQITFLQTKVTEQAQEIAKKEQQYQAKLKLQKEQALLQEQIKRDSWEKKKVKEIKHATIQSLEPEIKHLIDRHEIEMKTLKNFYEKKLAEQHVGQSVQSNQN